MGDVLAFAEQRDGVVRGITHEVLTAASSLAAQLGGEVHALAVGGPALDGAVRPMNTSKMRSLFIL